MVSAGRKSKVVLGAAVVFSLLALGQLPEAKAMGRGHVNPTVTPTPAPPTGTSTQPIKGADSCASSDPNHICIGLKLVSYEKSGVPILAQADAIKLVREISSVWSQCNIGFQLETYEQIDPTLVGLAYDSNWQSDGDAIRATFNDNTSFLVVALGKLSGATIGVTEMPGSGVYGSLIEDAYTSNSLTVGHELGHYQGLYHVTTADNLMYAYIGAHTATLTADQCTTARATDTASWQAMLRK